MRLNLSNHSRAFILRPSRTFTSSATRAITLALALLPIISACSPPGSTLDIDAEGSSTLKVTPPALVDSRALDFAELELVVLINNRAINMEQRGENWVGSTSVPLDSSVTLAIEWHKLMPDTSKLLLARAVQTISKVDRAIAFSVVEDSYIHEGAEFDADSDGLSNISELRQDFDPYNPDSPGSGLRPRVKVPASSRTTTIDGFIDGTGFWNNAQYEDVEENSLFINHLIRDDGGMVENTSPDYQWAAIHDGKYLTLFVFGKRTSDPGVSVNGDSGSNFFNDDSLEIYWDGNLSRLSDYDTVDDMLIIIPLLRGPDSALVANKSGEANTRIQRGANVKDEFVFDVLDESIVEFATCLCSTERVTWEVRIDLEAAKIPINKTFGFELQINRDDDGGERDSKWAWERPARLPSQTNAEVDVTWRYPNVMGQIILQPFP